MAYRRGWWPSGSDEADFAALVASGQVEAITRHRKSDGEPFQVYRPVGEGVSGLSVIAEPPDAELSDDDFRLLNALEEEARRINVGAFETTLTPIWLAAHTNRPLDEVRAALTRLGERHYLLWMGEAVRWPSG